MRIRSLGDMAQDFNPAIFQAALLEVAEATKAATTAVQAMQAAQQQQPAAPQAQPAAATGSPTGSPGGATDWSKLVNKPPLLDGKTVEDEISQRLAMDAYTVFEHNRCWI